jgi:hypothetical protein
MTESHSKKDDPLAVTDAYEHWIDQALKRAEFLGFPIEQALSSLGIVVQTVGREWLDSELKRENLGTTWQEPLNFIARALILPGYSGVMRIIELATYFRQFRETPRFSEVLTLLRRDSERRFMERGTFPSGYFQLSLAYRLARVGFTIAEFEPPMRGGRKADIMAELGAARVACECYCPRVSESDSSHEIMHSIKLLDEAAWSTQRALCVDIRLLRPLSPQFRKRVIGDAIRSVLDTPFGGMTDRLTQDAQITVTDYGPLPEGGEKLPEIDDSPRAAETNPTWQTGTSRIPVGEARELRDGKSAPDRVESLRLRVWKCPQEESAYSLSNFLSRLTKKARTKAAQTRSAESNLAERLIVIEAHDSGWLAANREALLPAIEKELRLTGVAGEPNILVCARHWDGLLGRLAYTQFLHVEAQTHTFAGTLARELILAEPVAALLAPPWISPSDPHIRTE